MGWRDDYVPSMKAFRHVVWPAPCGLHGIFCYGSKLIDSSEMGASGARQDREKGIDAIVEEPNGKKYRIAYRVQFDCDYLTFTIRTERDSYAETELAKRARELQNGELVADFTAQAYVTGTKDDYKEGRYGKLLSWALVRTARLYQIISEHPGVVVARKNDPRKGSDTNKFGYVSWASLTLTYGLSADDFVDYVKPKKEIKGKTQTPPMRFSETGL